MDLEGILNKLYTDKARIDRVIDELTQLQESHDQIPMPKPPERRGRKSMSPAERLEVSERMRKYWAGRRFDKETDLALGA